MLELIIALVLIALNGLFSLSELAVVSARKVRLQTMADQGRAGAATALKLAEDPGRFLSTVQIGITLVGILAGAFSGAALSQSFDEVLEGWGVPTRVAEPLAYVLVIGFITYLSVIIGELVPKHLALKNPEGIACAVAPLMAVGLQGGGACRHPARCLDEAPVPALRLLHRERQLRHRGGGQDDRRGGGGLGRHRDRRAQHDLGRPAARRSCGTRA